MWYLLTTRHLRCVSEMREGRGGSQTSSTVGTFKYLTLTLTWQDLQGGKCKGVWKKSAYQPVSNSAKDTDTDKSSKCPLRFTNCLTLLCSSYILESVCNRKRYYKKSHLIYRLAICSGWKPGAGSPLYPCGPANTPLGSTQRPKSVRLNSCLPPNPSSPPRESNIWL